MSKSHKKVVFCSFVDSLFLESVHMPSNIVNHQNSPRLKVIVSPVVAACDESTVKPAPHSLDSCDSTYWSLLTRTLETFLHTCRQFHSARTACKLGHTFHTLQQPLHSFSMVRARRRLFVLIYRKVGVEK